MPSVVVHRLGSLVAVGLAAILLVALPVRAWAAPSSAQAKAFVTSIYFGHTTQANAQLYDSSLVALLAEDRKLTPNHKEGALDFSPICWCQNSTGLTFVIGPIALVGPSNARVTVKLENHGKTATQVELDLVAVSNAWRIHDIVDTKPGDPKSPSMRTILIDANTARARGSSACAVPDAPPRVVHLVQPGYDQLAFEVGAAGTLRVHVTVSKSGRAVAAAVPGAHPYAGLDHYAITAALASTYAAASRNCEPVQGTLTVPMVFPPKGFKLPKRRG
jgi:hypothetical protein